LFFWGPKCRSFATFWGLIPFHILALFNHWSKPPYSTNINSFSVEWMSVPRPRSGQTSNTHRTGIKWLIWTPKTLFLSYYSLLLTFVTIEIQHNLQTVSVTAVSGRVHSFKPLPHFCWHSFKWFQTLDTQPLHSNHCFPWCLTWPWFDRLITILLNNQSITSFVIYITSISNSFNVCKQSFPCYLIQTCVFHKWYKSFAKITIKKNITLLPIQVWINICHMSIKSFV